MGVNARSQNFYIPKKLETANFNSWQKVRDFLFLNGTIHHVVVEGAVSGNSFIVFNPLIVWNNPFEVDDPFTEKPVGWFAQAKTENCNRVKF